MHIGIHWTQMPIARGPASVTSYARAPVHFTSHGRPAVPFTSCPCIRTMIHLLCMNPCTSIYLLFNSPCTIYLYARIPPRVNSYAGDPALVTASTLQGCCDICKSKEEWYLPDSGRSERLFFSLPWLWIRALGCMDTDPVLLLGKKTTHLNTKPSFSSTCQSTKMLLNGTTTGYRYPVWSPSRMSRPIGEPPAIFRKITSSTSAIIFELHCSWTTCLKFPV